MPKPDRASSPSISPELVRLIQQVCPVDASERLQDGRASGAGRLQRNAPTATTAAAVQRPVRSHADYGTPKSPSMKVGCYQTIFICSKSKAKEQTRAQAGTSWF
jgi:hypothetical protein